MTAGTPDSAVGTRRGWTFSPAWLLSLPALVFFALIVVVPLLMTVLLSFHDWGE